MNPNIEAIFLDVGNTLRIVLNDPEFSQKAAENLHAAVERNSPWTSLFQCLKIVIRSIENGQKPSCWT